MWFLSREKEIDPNHPRRNKILFIDARDMGTLINRRTRELSQEDIRLIADTYHNWRNNNGEYKDVPGFCKSATIEEVAAFDYMLTPGRYIGLPEEDALQKIHVGIDKIPSRAKRKVKVDDVLISTVRPNQKHYGIIRNFVNNFVVSTGFELSPYNCVK